jgi:hypothetical protein
MYNIKYRKWRYSDHRFGESGWIWETQNTEQYLRNTEHWAVSEKHRTLSSIASQMPFNICCLIFKIILLKWSPWHAIHFSNRDRKLTITAQRHTTCFRRCSTLITFGFWKSSHSFVARYGKKEHAMVEIRAKLWFIFDHNYKNYVMPERPLRRYNFKKTKTLINFKEFNNSA